MKTPLIVESMDAQVRQYELEKQRLERRINDLEIQSDEYRLVLDLLRDVEPSRPCSRLVAGVLVPHTAAEVKPALETGHAKVNLSLNKCHNDLTELNRQMSASPHGGGSSAVRQQPKVTDSVG